jgi:uncharacterized protein YdeI (YjbR/CyaY-like superfamily)
MNVSDTLYVTTRKQWRDWLSDNFDKTEVIWLVYPKKKTGKIRILYNDAVEEALCFGWIDSTIKTFNKDHIAQRFTPRNPKSDFSQANKERLKWLLDNNMIHSSIKKDVQDIIGKEFIFSNDIINAIKNDKTAWTNYQGLSESYKRIRIAYIESARHRPDEFKKRLSNFLDKTRDNKLIRGFGGIEKYY